MNQPIRIGILGYGNLGRGVELALRQNPDLVLTAFFTRRDPAKVKTLSPEIPVYPADDLQNHRDDIDVLILCGGSATDLPVQSPKCAAMFNIVDSFDNHGGIPNHFAAVDSAAKASGHTAMICAGWDPGLFSMLRLLGEAVLPQGSTYTFWGKGVSQGHSDAIRRIDGVLDARQYTIPIEQALERVRSGENPALTTREKHLRRCFVVAAEGADKAKIEETIKTMPGYFADYDTTVTFISQEELNRDHKGLPHGGFVLRSGVTGEAGESNQLVEFSLKLDSNPEFTSSVIVACARAVYRLRKEGQTGAKTVLDVPLGYLSPKSAETLRKELL
jgi:diaminopimelate dehydrogenase